MSDFFQMLRRTSLLCIAIGEVLGGCAANRDLPSYKLSSNGEASVQLAIIEGTLVRRGRICAYVFSVDEEEVGDRADCTVAIPLLPGKHIIAAWIEARASFYEGFRSRLATATLNFDAEEGHRYKISLARVGFSTNQLRARVWINDETTQIPATEAKLVTSPLRSNYPDPRP
jgi:hypothetical protein